MQEILEDSCFIEKCLLNIRFGAISELLQTFIRLPQTYEESDTLKQVRYLSFLLSDYSNFPTRCSGSFLSPSSSVFCLCSSQINQNWCSKMSQRRTVKYCGRFSLYPWLNDCIFRDLREKLYSSDEKTDPLHDEMQSDEAIQQIITAMLKVCKFMNWNLKMSN